MTETAKTSIPSFEKKWALFLDVDGTLVDFVDHPDRAKAEPSLVRLLERLYRSTEGAVALISGRTIESVDAIFEPLVLPVAGVHGFERRGADGRLHRGSEDEDALRLARERFRTLVDRHPGSFIEEKGPAIALHFRRVAAAAEDAETLASELEHDLPRPYCVQRGKMVVEIRSCSHSKASAIESFMDELPFCERKPVFVGDDATDELGFRWINEHGGISVKVGMGESDAGFRIGSVERVTGWLEDYARFLQGEDGKLGHVS